MKRILLPIALSASLFCCTKKSQDPKPEETQKQQTVQTATIPEPYYPRLGRAKEFDDVPVVIGGISYVERYIGHDDTHVPKADVYFFQQLITENRITRVGFESKLRIWWVNDTPHSDSLRFKMKDGKWLQTIWQLENKIEYAKFGAYTNYFE